MWLPTVNPLYYSQHSPSSLYSFIRTLSIPQTVHTELGQSFRVTPSGANYVLPLFPPQYSANHFRSVSPPPPAFPAPPLRRRLRIYALWTKVRLQPFEKFLAFPPSPTEFAPHFVIFVRNRSIASFAHVYGEASIVSSFLTLMYTFFKISTSYRGRTCVRRLNAMSFVPAATLGANSVANKLLPALLFCDPYFGIRFQKVVVLIPTSIVRCQCGSKMSRCVDTKLPTISSVSLMCVLGHIRTIENTWRRVKVFHTFYNRIGELRLTTNRQRLWLGADLTTRTAYSSSSTSSQALTTALDFLTTIVMSPA